MAGPDLAGTGRKVANCPRCRPPSPVATTVVSHAQALAQCLKSHSIFIQSLEYTVPRLERDIGVINIPIFPGSYSQFRGP